MKSVLFGLALAVGIAVVAGVALQTASQSSASRYSTEAVRL